MKLRETDWSNENILVLGAGMSGVAAAEALIERGAKVTLADAKPIKEFTEAAHDLSVLGVNLRGDGFCVNTEEYTGVIISPGISPEKPELSFLKESKLPVWGELELAYNFSSAPFVAITGTNGKTTTTSLVGHIMRGSGINTFVGGNIGKPLVWAAAEYGQDDLIVAEVSSFQLETIHSFAPKVALITNFTPDHLDRHGSMENYMLAKCRIYENQSSEDVLILNLDDPKTKEALDNNFLPQTHGKIAFFSKSEQRGAGAFVRDGMMILRDFDGKEEAVLPIKDICISGEHNIENALSAASIAYFYGVKKEVIASSLREFAGVAHRQELIANIRGVLYVNDSKGTNVDSTICALRAYENQILLLGGYDKKADFSPLLPYIHKNVKQVIVYGATRNQIKETLVSGGFTNILDADCNFEKAVHLAASSAKEGDVVMLSPACASWDMFPNFEARGDRFRAIVRDLNNKKY